MKTIKEWVVNEYDLQAMKDIVTYGIQGGFSGMTHYSETVSFYEEYEKEIWQMLDKEAMSQGQTILEFVSKLNGQKEVASLDQFKNLLAWYAVERTCQAILHSDE